MECISSSSKRPGRPRNSTNANRQNTNPPPRTTSNTPEPSLAKVELQPLANVDDWFNLGMLDSDYDMCTPPWATLDSGFGSLDSNSTGHTLSTLSTPPVGTPTSAALNGLMTDFSLSEHFPNLQCEQDETMLQFFGDQQPLPNFDHGVELSVLQRELSKQLYTLKSMPWDMTKLARFKPLSDTEANPLAQVVQTSADFAKLLCSVQAQTTADQSNDIPRSSIHPHLNIADLLTILSCHMLTISIYDFIFSHFSDQVSQNPGAVNMVLQTAPKLFLGGIEIPTRLDTLSYLLYCLTESHLRPIERLLGLPDEFCVSPKRKFGEKDSQIGLFSGQKLKRRGLVKSAVVWGVIASLKEKIRRVHGLD
ncbi:hypothetical protein N0V90_001909 [Kalmusia sp. IMI 367209]|nr:hypothetical protein N0V90_001909 [Kalmusia sp. IMI 367209]